MANQDASMNNIEVLFCCSKMQLSTSRAPLTEPVIKAPTKSGPRHDKLMQLEEKWYNFHFLQACQNTQARNRVTAESLNINKPYFARARFHTLRRADGTRATQLAEVEEIAVYFYQSLFWGLHSPDGYYQNTCASASALLQCLESSSRERLDGL